ncbi:MULTISPECIES: M20/M25/M40 family metallo-hydrolase [Kribbella]|uniref:M20/M25/M40 family metallo-hydrolase n=1 Tax=Kribbella TaxID=182639 RepID=UPI001042D410|nr:MULTISPECIES: M20/M25/M40 family metallo-hydrolase [Kribbella]
MLPPAVLGTARRWRSDRLADLRAWLAIPSVSGDPAREADVARAARWLASWQRAHGARVEVVPTSRGRDVVLGHWAAPPGAPLVVIYGHYDVQPAGSGWSSDPFTPVVRDGVLYARGAGDDKGQLFAHLCALDAWRQAGVPPMRVLVIAEGAEEVGSPGFEAVLRRLARRVTPRAVVVSDTERDAEGAPTVTVSQRGHLVGRLEVDTGGPDVHPGRLGGAVVDPSLVLAEALLALRDGLLPQFDTNPAQYLGAHPAQYKGAGAAQYVEARTDAAVARAAGGRAMVGAGLDERITLRGALDVTRLATEARGGAVPARSEARIDLRLPPRADPAAVLRRVRRLLDGLAPPGTTLRLRVAATTPGVATMPDPPTRRAADEACVVGFGRTPTYVRSGGTVPAVGMMARAFGIRPLLLGFGTPDGNAHGPDEAMDLRGWAAAVDTSAAFLFTLARQIRAGPVSAGRQEITMRRADRFAPALSARIEGDE